MVSRKTILTHFQQTDPVIAAILESWPFETKLAAKDPSLYFPHLVENIIGQQLSTKVADVITTRFQKLFNGQPYTPELIITTDPEVLRSLGISYAKIRYLKDLAQHTIDQKINYSNFHKMTDEDVVLQLTKVKGIGPWTAEMFLIFSLGRENVFSFGDGGLQRAIFNIYGFEKKQDFTKIMRLIKKWHPYKSYASLALWRSLDNITS